MSALTDRIATEHQRVYNRPNATCLCGWDRNYNGDQQPFLRHIAEVTETAVREHVAREIETVAIRATRNRTDGLWDAARIARGEA